MIWSYTNMPPSPLKLFLVTADYNMLRENHPVYEIAATNKTKARKFFKNVYSWLKVISIEEAPKDYQPNQWFINRYGKRRDYI